MFIYLARFSFPIAKKKNGKLTSSDRLITYVSRNLLSLICFCQCRYLQFGNEMEHTYVLINCLGPRAAVVVASVATFKL